MDKFILKKKFQIFFFAFIYFLSGIFLLSQSEIQIRPPVDTSIPLGWTNGYTLILLQDSEMLSVNEAKDFIVGEGGTVAIYSSAHAMLGWISPSVATKILGKHGIEAVFFERVDLEGLKYQDKITLSFIKFFNSVVSGEVERQYRSFRIQGDPLVGDFREHPFVDPNVVIANLEDKHVAWDTEIVRIAENRGIFPGYSDYMTGTIAACLMFIESNGSIDSNLYSWTTSAMDLVINQCLSGASWWASKASSYSESASFYIYYYDPTRSLMQQGYEPILHRSSDDSLWINRIMSNIGFSSGTKNDRVTAFNAWLKDWAGTRWAYSCFFAYNPPGSETKFTDGYFAYAYLGGPYIQMLYRNNGWSTGDIWSIFAHETGHIFWACDEYYQAGYGGCTSCAACSSFRPITNKNCEHPSCNPYGSVPCMMKANSNALCLYSAAQVGWQTQTMTKTLTIQSSQYGTTSPVPGEYYYATGAQVQVTATPDTNCEFVNWTGSISSTQNPVTVTMDADKTIKANFRVKPKLTIQSSQYGTTSPVPGEYYYATGAQVQVTATPDTNCEFVNWTGSISSTQNPVTVTMDGDKTIKANFRVKPKLTIQASQNGTTSPVPGEYYYTTGTQVQVTAIPDTYYVFINWTGSASGSDNPLSLTMNSDMTVKANFRFIYAPVAAGQKVLNRTFSQAEYIDILSWQPNQANEGLSIAKYRIYRVVSGAATLLVELAAGQLTYTRRSAGQGINWYAIAAVTSSGREGAPALISVQ